MSQFLYFILDALDNPWHKVTYGYTTLNAPDPIWFYQPVKINIEGINSYTSILFHQFLHKGKTSEELLAILTFMNYFRNNWGFHLIENCGETLSFHFMIRL